MSEELFEDLQDIGLSEKEAKVYLATLELGQETVQNISKKAEVNRATTYVVLEALQKKGIVSTFEQGKKALFIAEGPHALYNIIREQEEELEKRDNDLDGIMPELMSVFNLHPDKPKVTFYEGKDGLKSMVYDHFMKSKSKEAQIFFNVDHVSDLFSKEEKEMMRMKRIGEKIHLNVIYSSSKGIKDTSDLGEGYMVGSDRYPMSAEIEIFDEKVLIAGLLGDVSGLVIESKIIADTLKSIFRLSEIRAKELTKKD